MQISANDISPMEISSRETLHRVGGIKFNSLVKNEGNFRLLAQLCYTNV